MHQYPPSSATVDVECHVVETYNNRGMYDVKTYELPLTTTVATTNTHHEDDLDTAIMMGSSDELEKVILNKNQGEQHNATIHYIHVDGLGSTSDDTNVVASRLNRARELVQDTFSKSRLLDGNKELIVPRFDWSEISVGNVLGVGGFGTVKELTRITISAQSVSNVKKTCGSFSFRSWTRHASSLETVGSNKNASGGSVAGGTSSGTTSTPARNVTQYSTPVEGVDFSPEDESYYEKQNQDRRFIAENAVRKGGIARYAIKQISPEVANDPRLFIQAAMDMSVETYFLSILSHSHIIKMRAVGQGDMFDKDYFIVLDRLYDTLQQRIAKWRVEDSQIRQKYGCFARGKRKRKLLDSLIVRLKVISNLAGALTYLHQLNILYRDLKPENIGFDVVGKVKLFDFGLCKELNPEKALNNGTYKLTGMAGSIRYMAPENIMKRPYNLSADVYSFGILMWEVVSMETPFDGYSCDMIIEAVCRMGERPKIPESWSKCISSLVCSCWSESYKVRPTFEVVEKLLADEIALNDRN